MERSPSTKPSSLAWKCVSGLVLALVLNAIVVAQKTDSDQPDNSAQASSKDKKDQKEQPPTVKLRIQVSTSKGKPIGEASVYIRFNESGGVFHHDKLAELNLKTNQDGSVKVPEIPQGQIMIQVIAPGWHTFGKWYDIEQDEELVKITLEPPPHLY